MTDAAVKSERLGLIGCEVLRSAVEPFLERSPTWAFAEFLDAGLHTTPEKLRPAIQERLDSIPGRARIFLAYGLCGNGLDGLRSGEHTLIIPRSGDCIPILMGSYDLYANDLQENPGTYYLSEGWLENDFHPLGQYDEWCRMYDEKTADRLKKLYYKHYRRVLLMGFSQEEIDRNRELARKGAVFLGLDYTEQISSPHYLQWLLEEGMHIEKTTKDLLVIPPGSETDSLMFLRELQPNDGSLDANQ